MAVKIRLARGGRKKLPCYGIVVADARSPRDGRFIEKIGYYHPLLAKDNEQRVVFNKDRVDYWVSVGAEMTGTVSRLMDAKLGAA